MKSMLKVLSLSLFALVSFTQSAQAVILLDDNFDGENGGSFALDFTGFTNWNVLNGSVDLIGNGAFDEFPGNGLYVDLDGGTSDAGDLTSSTAFAFNPGDTVTLTFDILGEAGGAVNLNEMTVSLGGIFSEDFDSNTPTGMQTINAVVSSSETANLVFSHAGGDNTGLFIDNVVLQSSSASVPFEFSPGMGILLSMGVFGAYKYRKNKKDIEISRSLGTT